MIFSKGDKVKFQKMWFVWVRV